MVRTHEVFGVEVLEVGTNKVHVEACYEQVKHATRARRRVVRLVRLSIVEVAQEVVETEIKF